MAVKRDNGETKRKIMMEKVATNVVASLSPEWQGLQRQRLCPFVVVVVPTSFRVQRRLKLNNTS